MPYQLLIETQKMLKNFGALRAGNLLGFTPSWEDKILVILKMEQTPQKVRQTINCIIVTCKLSKMNYSLV
jgi:hypothetical protein